MEDDEESPSFHPSPVAAADDDDERGSSRPPQPIGRITVTVASPALPSQHSLTLALPIQNSRSTPPSSATASAFAGAGAGAGGGREDYWTEDATAVLIEAWGERYVELSRGNLKQKHWEEVAEIVSARAGAGGGKPAKTEVQCKNRIDTVKRKYKSEKAKIAAGGGPSKWPFFDRIDRLLGKSNSAAAAKISPAVAAAAAVTPSPVHKVPVGIPVGRSIYQPLPPPSKQRFSPIPEQNRRILRRNNLSPDSSDGLPPDVHGHQRSKKRQRTEFNSAPSRPRRRRRRRRRHGWGNSVRELTRAIVKFEEAYEQAESAKLQQMVEMEKQRMKFAKDLELQRMKFLMKTQLELSQLSRAGGGAGDSNRQVHRQINDGNDFNNGDCSN